MTAPDAGTPDPADVELAARAISLYDWDHQVSNNPEIGEHQRNEARAVLSALAATGRLADPEAETVWAWDCGEKPYPHPHVGPESWVRQIAPLHWPNGRAIRRSVGPWLPAPTEESA